MGVGAIVVVGIATAELASAIEEPVARVLACGAVAFAGLGAVLALIWRWTVVAQRADRDANQRS